MSKERGFHLGTKGGWVALWMALFLLVTLFLPGCLAFQQKPADYGLKKKDYVLVGKKRWRMRYHERGKPGQPAVVLLHGYGSAGLIWLPLMGALQQAGYHSIAPDLPGFGLSDKYKGNYDTQHIARLVLEMMRQKKIKRADMIAHSWGSSVALALTLQEPQRVRRLVIHSGWVYSAQIVPVIRWARLPVVGELIYGLFFRERPGEKYASSFYNAERMVNHKVVARIKESFRRPGYLAAALAVARGMRFQSIERRYRAIGQPTLLLWGKEDHVSLPFYGSRLEANLPNARLILLDRCGHIPMLERKHAVHRHVLRFLGPARKQLASSTSG